MSDRELKALLISRDASFWQHLAERSRAATSFVELFPLSALRRKAEALGMSQERAPAAKLRLALVGGYSLYPLHELIEHMLAVAGYSCELFQGQFDNYVSEMLDESGELHAFRPDVVLVLPSEARCKYQGQLTDPRDAQLAQARETSAQLLGMCSFLHERTRVEVLLCNFMLPANFDPGVYRTRTLGSDWNFRKTVNLELGLNAPPGVHILDAEFLANRRGALHARDDRAWFETKQPCAPDFLVELAREAAHLIASLRTNPKKVLVLDLDNTLWGGMVGDDGLEGIEIGDTSPRGEAFKAFQKFVLSLKARGVLLAVCSKNDHDKAVEPFESHPEMVLRERDFVSFKANWQPKSDNIKLIAAELGLGLDSFVFADDNPAEIEIVRRFVPEVTGVLLGPDPADYVRQLQDARLFELHSLTAEDALRTEQYRQEAERKVSLASAVDMASYLESLEMVGTFKEFCAVDAPRTAQLINKSNQFNLTTRRRTEAEVLALSDAAAHVCFTMRLADRFGDHGLISIIIGTVDRAAGTPVLELDTWVMSCRVLNRQVEEEVLNEVVRLARRRGCARVRGLYLPTAKNGLVRDLYPRLGFRLISERTDGATYECDTRLFQPFATKIRIARRAFEPDGSHRPLAGDFRPGLPGTDSAHA